jgi:hypothetical protein
MKTAEEPRRFIYAACVSMHMREEYDVKFQNPEFYDSDSTIVVAKYEQFEAIISTRGDSRAVHPDGREISKASEYQKLFNGDLGPLEEWAVIYKPWFRITIQNGGKFKHLSSYGSGHQGYLDLTQCLNIVKEYFLSEILD